MNALVSLSGGTAVTTTLAIAEGTDVEHASVIKLVRAYDSDLREFGLLDFKSESTGGRPMEYAALNEQQATLLLTFMRNSDIVRGFKLRLVKAFYALAQQVTAAFKVPTTLSEALRLAADQADRIDALALRVEQQRPAVEFVERYVDATGLKGFREVAKLLCANEREFRQFLFDHEVLYRLGGALTAHQPHITAGRIVVRTGVADTNGYAFNTVKFTPKGVEWIAGEWAKARVRELAHG